MSIIKKIFFFVKKYATVLLFFYWLILFIITSIPTVPVDLGFKWQDKLYHFIAFGILSFLIMNFFISAKNFVYNRKCVILVLTIVIFYAIIDELHQPMFGRVCDIWDFVFDSIGGIAGLLVFHYYYGIFKHAIVQ